MYKFIKGELFFSGTLPGLAVPTSPPPDVEAFYKIVAGNGVDTNTFSNQVVPPSGYPVLPDGDFYRSFHGGILGVVAYRVLDIDTGTREFVRFYDYGEGFNGVDGVDITDIVVGEGMNCKLLFTIITNDSGGSSEVVTTMNLSAVQGDIAVVGPIAISPAPSPYDYDLVQVRDSGNNFLFTENLAFYLDIPDPSNGSALIQMYHHVVLPP